MAAAFRKDAAKLATQANSLDDKEAQPGNQAGRSGRFFNAGFRTPRSTGVFVVKRLLTKAALAAASSLLATAG